MELAQFMDGLVRRNPNEREFHQAVYEVAEKVIPYINDHREYEEACILERMTEPDRIIIFRVTWEDDAGQVRVNRGYRVQFNQSIGPYKGGLRFDKSVTLSILKFLGFEQTFKNSLTTLPMGAAKGGADFNPKGKSDREVMRFCQAYMNELFRHIGEDTDVPAGDIGVGAREIGYLFGKYNQLSNRFAGVFTGKALEYGGSPVRTEATGYGCVYLAREMLLTRGEELEGKRCLVSGAGNVAQYAAQKLIQLGAKVLTLSDRTGLLVAPDGLTAEQLDSVIDLKTRQHGNLDVAAEEFGLDFHPNMRPWAVPCDAAFPCATQNELDGDDARILLDNGCGLVAEGANMPTTLEGVELFEAARILYAPGKAANAGGVSISGLEMSQNAMRLTWTREEVDLELQRIMRRIHEQCLQYGRDGDHINYVKGANIAGFKKVADAMLAYGIV